MSRGVCKYFKKESERCFRRTQEKIQHIPKAVNRDFGLYTYRSLIDVIHHFTLHTWKGYRPPLHLIHRHSHRPWNKLRISIFGRIYSKLFLIFLNHQQKCGTFLESVGQMIGWRWCNADADWLISDVTDFNCATCGFSCLLYCLSKHSPIVTMSF